VLSTRLVVALDVRVVEEDAVLDRDRVEVAGAGADERVARRFDRRRRRALAVARPEPELGREQEVLPRCRADVEAEQSLVVAASQAVSAALLLVRPARREVSGRLDLVVDDRVRADRGPDQAVAALPQPL
jgi:hypothetical protein